MQARGRAVLVIAHRLSTVRNADTILVMDKGRIAERGSHAQLLQQRGIYWGLVQRQQQGLAPEDRDLSPTAEVAAAAPGGGGGGGGGAAAAMPDGDGLQPAALSIMSVDAEDGGGGGVANDIVPLPMSSDSIKAGGGGAGSGAGAKHMVGADTKM